MYSQPKVVSIFTAKFLTGLYEACPGASSMDKSPHLKPKNYYFKSI